MRSDPTIFAALAALLVAPLALPLAGCTSSEPAQNERWVATEDTTVPLDWDKVNEAYKLAEGPEDLERRINEIYHGDEVISIAVADRDATTQVVTAFFDKNANGAVEDAEKVFTIQRDVGPDQTAKVQTMGYGPYVGYHSPILGIASGMMLGSMMSRALSPGYAPMYVTPYATAPSRVADLRQTRSAYRAANPAQFQKSKSGRTYGRTVKSPPPRRAPAPAYRGGGRFGASARGRATHIG